MASGITSTEKKLMQSIQSRYPKEEQSKDDHLREKLAIDRLIKLEREHRDILVPITWQLRLKLALDVCSGLCYMHDLRPPILHRDLKSPNIFPPRSLVGLPPDVLFFFNPEATPLAKVADFGLSIRLMGSEQLKVTTVDSPMANINPIWAAPEVLSRSEYSRAADIYAIGLILWELLVRERPFHDVPITLGPRVLMERIIEGHRPAVPPHLKTDPLASEYIQVMEQCWAPNPLSRPTIRSVKDALLLFAHVNLGVQQSQLIREGSSSSPSPVSQWQLVHPHHAVQFAPEVALRPIPDGKNCPYCHQGYTLFFRKRSHCITCSAFGCNRCVRSGACHRSTEQSPAQSVMQPTCLCILPNPLEHQIWLGFDNGWVGMYQTSDVPNKTVYCAAQDAHLLSVSALTFSNFVWSGSSCGLMRVWSLYLPTDEGLKDLLTLR